MADSMSVEEIISAIVVQPYKPEIINDTAILDSVFESDLLTEDAYSFIGPYLYRYWDLGLDQVPKNTHEQLTIFRLGVIGTESFNLLSNLYIPTTRDTGHTSNTLRSLHIVNISTVARPLDCNESDIYHQDPFVKALLLLNLPVNAECLVLDETLAHLKDLIAKSELDIDLQVKHSVSVKHKKLLSNEYVFENALCLLSVPEQVNIAQQMSKYFPLLHLPTTQEDASNQIDTGSLKMSSLQSFCIYQNLKLYISKVFLDQDLYTNPSIYIEFDKVKFQLKNTGSLNFKVGTLDTDKTVLENTFWQLINKGLMFDVNSFKSYVELKVDENSKTDVYTESKNDNIHFNSTYYELLLRLILDPDLLSDRLSIEEAILNKDFNSVLNVLSELPLFKE